MGNETIIRFEHICKNFGAVKALKDVTMEIGKGECHAILGENGAGKSTLMHLLSGIYTPDEGQIYIKGKPITLHSPHDSAQNSIAIVYQELKLCLNLDAAENIFLGKIPTKTGFLQKNEIYKETKEILDAFGVQIDIRTPVKNLGPAQMQLIEIAKAIRNNSDILILDEPTSSLTAVEADVLFRILNQLKEQGKTLIFISHRMNEIFAMADRISIMRDGRYLGTYRTEDVTENELVRMIAGEKRYDELYAGKKEAGETESVDYSDKKVALEIQGVNRGKYVQDASFKLYEGEILGLYGLQGAGRTELLETLFGLYGKVDGKVFIYGEETQISNPSDAIGAGLGLITEDRKNRGIFSLMNIRENIAVIHDKQITKAGIFVAEKKVNDISNEYVKTLSVKTDSIYQKIVNLSGGNQQKVILARMLSTNPRIILADEPTRGVDVGAKAEIFAIMNELKRQNKAIIVVSSELQEVVSECDRILVLRSGRIVGEVKDKEGREEKILNLAFSG